MAWWKKKAITTSEICGTRLPAGENRRAAALTSR
jgi:hypothetical protein